MSQKEIKNTSGRLIFRPVAIQRYMESREESIFPRLVSPRVILFLWVLLGMLMGAAFLAWMADVPVYSSGVAVVAKRSQVPQDLRNKINTNDDVYFLVFLTSDSPQIGQQLLVHLDNPDASMSREIVAVETKIQSPDDIRRRYALESGISLAVSQPAFVAIAQFEPFPTNTPSMAYLGSVFHVDIKVGTRRVISFLPWIGHYFDE